MGADLLLVAEQTRDLPMPPIAFGLVVFGSLVVAIIAVLMFGKGRPHT